MHCTSRQVYDDSRGNDGRRDDGCYGRVATDPSRGTGCGAAGGDATGGEKADATGSEKVASEAGSG